jgi:hypothetical protein
MGDLKGTTGRFGSTTSGCGRATNGDEQRSNAVGGPRRDSAE